MSITNCFEEELKLCLMVYANQAYDWMSIWQHSAPQIEPLMLPVVGTEIVDSYRITGCHSDKPARCKLESFESCYICNTVIGAYFN